MELLVVVGFAVLAVVAVGRAPALQSYAWLLVPAVWATCTLVPTRVHARGWSEIGLKTGRVGASLWAFAWTSAVMLLVMAGGVLVFRRLAAAPPLWPTVGGEGWVCYGLYQLLYVAVSEELFFRGYVQGRLAAIAQGKKHRRDAFAIVGSAAVFAGAHLIVLQQVAAAWVFLPGLLFGWLRARTDSLLAPVLSHATANTAYAAVCAVLCAAE